MADRDDDDEFAISDNDFDNLPASTLQDLECDALQFTQLPKSQVAPAPQSQPRHRPVAHSRSSRVQKPFQPPRRIVPPKPPSSDYGLDDEDVIDLDEQPLPIANGSRVQAEQAYQEQRQEQPVFADTRPAQPQTQTYQLADRTNGQQQEQSSPRGDEDDVVSRLPQAPEIIREPEDLVLEPQADGFGEPSVDLEPLKARIQE
ncbi:hypothetical protein LTS18_013185, partial [Coniosporium uncinatum]